jgi:hypothetical protein
MAYTRAAEPRLTVPAESRELVLAVPGSPAGSAVRDVVMQGLGNVTARVLESEGDVVLCLESAPQPLALFATAIIGDNPAYADAAFKVMTRTDVNWSSSRLAETQAIG